LRDGKRDTKAQFEMAIAFYHMKQIPRAMELLKQCIATNPKDIPARIYLSRCEQFLSSGLHHSTGELNQHMQWKEGYQVHIDVVDLSHRHLFSKVNEFISASIAGDFERVNLLLSYLECHLVESKEEEEYLMADCDYPFMKHHQREHRRFINDFAVLKEAFDKESMDFSYLTFRIQLLMFDWFNSHILNSDRHASRHILHVKKLKSIDTTSLRLNEYFASVGEGRNSDL
jgi:hemerythrin